MTEILTSAQMKAVETAAIESGRVSGLELMERAGRGAVEAALAHWPEYRAGQGHRAVVLAGPGNNGGDGFVIARLLAGRGWSVALYLFGDPDRLPPDAAANRRRWEAEAGGTVQPLEAAGGAAFAGGPLVVDALFGTGLARPVPGLVAQVLGRAADCPILAVDILSGADADGGPLRVPGAFPPVRAGLTVAFERAKIGHHSGPGAERSAALAVVPIGLDADVRAWAADRPAEVCRLVDRDTLPLDRLAKGSAAHKYGHGHAVILSGGPGRGGAARMAARAALRAGAGLVTLACPPAALQENAARLDAVMLHPLRDAAGLAALLGDRRFNALGLGPALGLDDGARGRVLAALGAGRGTVLDADALTGFSDAPETLFGALHDRCLLTPHAGEFARLFPDIVARVSESPVDGAPFSRVDAVRAAAARAGATVLLKGADTVVAAPDGRAALHSARYAQAAPWLATAGAGDVLTGIAAGLMARGFDPLEAGTTAAWLHAAAARHVGAGLIAEDLPEALPAVFRGLGL